MEGTPTDVEDRQAELERLYTDLALLHKLSPEMTRLFVMGSWKAAGYPSASEADLALFGAVLRLTCGERGRAMDLLQISSLVRDKWNRPDYVKSTFDKVKLSKEDKLPDRTLGVERFRDIQMERIEWFWPGVVPRDASAYLPRDCLGLVGLG